jgi:hypothetical protein
MSTPGNFIIPDKTHVQSIPATGQVDGGTLLRFRDAPQGIDNDRFALPIGDTTFWLEIQATLSSTVNRRPTWIQGELVRFKLDGSVDSTGKSRRGIVQPGTTTWADVFSVSEYVDEHDGYFGWTITHGRPADGVLTSPISVTVCIYEAKNALAHHIYRLGGFNRMSDGWVADYAWRVPPS